MSELRLRLDMKYDYQSTSMSKRTRGHVGGPFAESTERFERLASMSTAHRNAVELGEVSEIPAVLSLDQQLRMDEPAKGNAAAEAREVNCF